MSASIGYAHHVARKAHTCSWCGQDILARERYARWCWIDDYALTVKMHVECEGACNELEPGETFDPGQNERPKP